MKPQKLAAAGILITNGCDFTRQHAEHGPAGVPVLAMRLNLGQLARIQKTTDMVSLDQRNAIR
jgi:hypothetical protein